MSVCKVVTLMGAAGVALSAVSGCSGSAKVNVGPAGSCPMLTSIDNSKIHHLAFLEGNEAASYEVSVDIRPPMGSCDEGDDTCVRMDQELLELQRQNQSDADCVLTSLERDGKRPVVAPVWYRLAPSLKSGQPVPIGTSFAITARLSDMEALTQSPLVQGIDPAPGQGAGVPVSSPAESLGCPTLAEAVGAKLAEVDGTQNKGRQPVVVELRDAGFLPETVPCAAGQTCTDSEHRMWERTILNTRELTCIRRWIDAKLSKIPEPVDYASGTGSALAGQLPPFGQSAGTVKAQAMMLSWDEASLVASHPYVERIWTSPTLKPPVGGDPACPPDLNSPIPQPVCTSDREAVGDKIDAHSQMIFEATPAKAMQAVIRVKGGATICPLDSCSQKDCPSSAAIQARWSEENLVSQKCVRDLISTLGGSSSPEAPWLVDSFVATVNWQQIQSVATHPNVTHIESNLQ